MAAADSGTWGRGTALVLPAQEGREGVADKAKVRRAARRHESRAARGPRAGPPSPGSPLPAVCWARDGNAILGALWAPRSPAWSPAGRACRALVQSSRHWRHVVDSIRYSHGPFLFPAPPPRPFSATCPAKEARARVPGPRQAAAPDRQGPARGGGAALTRRGFLRRKKPPSFRVWHRGGGREH